MTGIFKVNNVYVVVRDKEVREGIEKNNMPEYIISDDDFSATLYGGRVLIERDRSYFRISIDGIAIYEIKQYSNSIELFESDYIKIEKIVAYLNQIENLGIETFLENYRKQLETLKGELERVAEKIQEDLGEGGEKNSTRLAIIRRLIIKISSFLFALYVNMNAGLQAQDYIDAYNMVINMYF